MLKGRGPSLRHGIQCRQLSRYDIRLFYIWLTLIVSALGNEAKYVIVSLVRSSRPAFLRSVRRMNVMLTRCRQGLIIVSSQAFLGPGGKGSDTLLGKLVQHWQSKYSQTWVGWNSVLNASVDLPGAKGSFSNNSTGSRPPGKAKPQHKPSPKGNSVTGSTITAQGQKESKVNRSKHGFHQQTKVIKEPTKQQSNSRNTTKAQRS